MEVEKRKGRYPISEEGSVALGLKIPKELERRVVEKVREMRDKKYRTGNHKVCKSNLVATLIGYSVDMSEEIYDELFGGEEEKT